MRLITGQLHLVGDESIVEHHVLATAVVERVDPVLLDRVGIPLAAGVDLKSMSTILGHSQISVAADRYGHVSTAMARPALERLNALLRH